MSDEDILAKLKEIRERVNALSGDTNSIVYDLDVVCDEIEDRLAKEAN